MDNNETPENENNNFEFAKEIGKTLILSTATSVGIWGGIALVAVAYTEVQSRLESRRTKKTQNES